MTITPLFISLTMLMQPQLMPTPALQTFIEHVEREWPGERAQQDINCRALDLMAAAVESVATERGGVGPAIARELSDFREGTRAYCAGAPNERRQPERLRRAFIDGSSLIAALVKSTDAERNRAARLNALERAAKSLDDDAPLRRQPDVIERFFHHGAEVLSWLHGGSKHP